MGNGLHAAEVGAASFSALTVDGAPVLPLNYFQTKPNLYSVKLLATTGLGGFRFGGPGAC